MKKRSTMLLFSALVGGCGVTTGKRVVLETELKSSLSRGEKFTNGLGWEIELESAMISTGAMYYFDGEPAFTMAPVRSIFREVLDGLSPISIAYAHPGHYSAGNAQGEVLRPFSADVLAGPTLLPTGDGISGWFRSGTFSFSNPSEGPVAAMLEGHAALVTGRATKGDQIVDFVASADLLDIEHTAKDGQITGCVFEETVIDTDGKILITVKPQVWFNLVDFSESFEADGTARVAFSLGLGQLSAYAFSVE